MSDSKRFYDTELRRELKKILARTFLLRLASGLVSFLAVGAWVFLALVVWTAATESPPLWQALVVSRATWVIFALVFAALVVYPIIRLPRLGQLAEEVESRKDFKDIVVAGFEFSQNDDAATRYSPDLVREVIRQAVRSIAGLEVRFLFLEKRQLLLVPAAYLALFILLIIGLLSPSALLTASERLTSPRTAAAVEHEPNLLGSPGNVTVIAGSDVEVKALDFGGADRTVTLSYNLSESFWKTERTRADDVYLDGETRVQEYTYTFRDVRNSIEYYFQAGERRSPTYRVTVVHHPIVTDLNIVLTPPEYTGESPDTLAASGGNIQALEGTRVDVTARTNNKLAGAWVQFDDGPRKPVDHQEHSLAFDFVALRDGTYSIRLADDLGHKTDDPLVYGVEVYQDNAPLLDVLEPGGDAALPRNLEVRVSFVASDDYGVRKAAIYHRRAGEEHYRGIAIPLGSDKDKKEVAKSFMWTLEGVDLFPGDYVEYFIQVEDNNVVTGPGVTKSRVFHITVPTMAELYERIQEEDTRRKDLFEEAIEESQDLKERVEKLSREFKKNEELDWSQKKEIDKAMTSQEAIQEKLEDINQSLEETLQSLSDNQMTSQQIGEKMEEISRLLEEINSEELNKYMEDLREAMEKLDPEDIQKALENLNLSAEEMLERLERTEALLREIAKEQKMEEIVRKTQDLLEKQEDLHERTGESDVNNEGEMKDLAGEQSDLADKAKELEKDLGDMSEMLAQDEQDKTLAEEMQDMEQEFSEQDPSGKMQQASDQLQQQQKSSAQRKQEEAMQDMIALFQRAAAFQAQMQAQSNRRVAENLQRLAKSTLELSFKQEQLTERVRSAVSEDDRPNISNLAQEQQTYMRAVEQIADEVEELGKKSVAIPEFLLQGLGATISSMQTAMMFLEENKAFMSTTSAGQAVTDLNLVTMELLTACQQCQSGQGSGSQQSSLMEQLLNGQRQLLQQSQELAAMQAAQERLLQQRLAELDRLAGRQRSLQEMAKELEKELKQNKRSLGRMDRTIEQMEEVIRDLESGVLDEETLRREENILSRLLDAQRSVHTRDYEKKRLSETANDVFSNATDRDAAKAQPQLLREDIRRAMLLKAPGEFEDLIRLYFRALAEESPGTTVPERTAD